MQVVFSIFGQQFCEAHATLSLALATPGFAARFGGEVIAREKSMT
jgi:hypothetical protein